MEFVGGIVVLFISWIVIITLFGNGDESFSEKIKFAGAITGVNLVWVIIGMIITGPVGIVIGVIFLLYLYNKSKEDNTEYSSKKGDWNIRNDFNDFANKYLKVLYGSGTKFKDLKNDAQGLCIEIKDYIQNMNYSTFLATTYWKTIAHKVKKESNYQCTYCGSTQDLEVHHITYENHGCEHKYWKTDLICLCHQCHDNEHN